MNKDKEKFFKFLYDSKKKWVNFCFSWLKSIWVKNWKNIPSYNENYDILKQTWIKEKELKLIIYEEANIYKNIENKFLVIWLTDKWIKNYIEFIKPWYKKIKIDWKWLIWIIITSVLSYLKIKDNF